MIINKKAARYALKEVWNFGCPFFLLVIATAFAMALYFMFKYCFELLGGFPHYNFFSLFLSVCITGFILCFLVAYFDYENDHNL